MPRIIKKRARKALPPRLQNRFQRAAVEMRLEHAFKKVNNTQSCDPSTDRKVDCRARPDQEWSGGIQPHHLAVPLKFPGWRCASGKLAAQACMREQVARVARSPARLEIARSRRRRKTLHPWPDRDCDHVLLKPLVIANARIAADPKYINEPILNHDLYADFGIGLHERRDNGWQYDPRGARRHVEFERARRLIPKPGPDTQRRLHLAEQWHQLFHETQSRFGRGDAARGSV